MMTFFFTPLNKKLSGGLYELDYKLFEDEIEDLVELLTQNKWVYYTDQNLKEESIRKTYTEGYYHSDRETHWIIDNEEKVGIIIIHDIRDTIPLFDIRLDTRYRGKGYGVKTLLWLQVTYLEKKVRFVSRVIRESIILV